MKRASWERHKLKKSLKSAASLIRAIEWFAKFFERVEPLGGSGVEPVSAGLLFRFLEAACGFNLPVLSPEARRAGLQRMELMDRRYFDGDAKQQVSLRLLEHPEKRRFGAFAERFFHLHAGLERVQAVAEFLQGVHLHVAAVRAGAAVGGAGDEVLVRAFLAQAVQHAALGDDDDVFDRRVLAVGDHLLGRADFVSQQPNRLGAFRVGDDEGVGIFRLDPVDGVAGELDVDITVALPQIHLAAGLLHDPGTEVFVRDKKDGPVSGSELDDFHGVAGGADDVAERFDAAGAVDVGDDVVVFLRVRLEEGFELVGGAGLFERAAGVGVGQDDDFFGVHDLGGLRHEVDAAEGDDVGIGGLGMIGEAERVAHVVGDVLDVAGLIVVREDDGVPAFFRARISCLRSRAACMMGFEISGLRSRIGEFVTISMVPVCFAPGLTMREVVRTRP